MLRGYHKNGLHAHNAITGDAEDGYNLPLDLWYLA
jgi:hypothetical protein